MKIPGNLLNIFLVLSCFFFSCNKQADSDQEAEKSRYTEAYRPQFHFSPDSMWMNDPNGMVFFEGEYHLFYQHHPHSNVWGPMHWGHAVSSDLIHWEHLPIALYPDSLGTIFSGSAVIDWNNTSGLGSAGNPPMVAIFTHHNQKLAEAGSNQFQYQSLAYSLDRGRSWSKFPGNPVLPNPGIRDFRDPKVSWYPEGEKWIMTLAAQDRIMFFSSPDLIQWTPESEFGENTGAHGGVWECPDLFPMDVNGKEKWVLLVSINPGGPNGGSATQYFVGEFDGKRFHNENPGTAPMWIDYGKDNYAGVTWSDIPPEDGRRIFMGWMSNWQYANNVPTEIWRSAMTLPRELRLDRNDRGYVLHSYPVAETEKLRKDRVSLEPGPVGGRFRQHAGPPVDKGLPLFEIDLTFAYDADPADESKGEEGIEFGIILQNAQHEKLVLGFNTLTGNIHVDRALNSGLTDFSEHFPGKHLAPYRATGQGEMRFHVFVDLSSIELFVDHGAAVMTEIAFPDTGFDTILLYASHESVQLKKGEIFSLEGIW